MYITRIVNTDLFHISRPENYLQQKLIQNDARNKNLDSAVSKPYDDVWWNLDPLYPDVPFYLAWQV